MLSNIKIKGWRSLADIDLDLKPLNVLIGPNGCGKTNFLDVFRFFSEVSHGELADGIMRRGGWTDIHYRGFGYQNLMFCFEFPDIDEFHKDDLATFELDLMLKEFYPVIGKESIYKPPRKTFSTPWELVYRDLRVCKFQNHVTSNKDEFKYYSLKL